MADDDIKICELLQAKFCHDMAGTLSAINNSVEFLSASNSNLREKANNLIQVSAAESVAKLQFYRMAYGNTTDVGEANLAELRSIINNFASYTKASIVWPDSNLHKPSSPITHRLAKIILNLIPIIIDSLIYGGTINIDRTLASNGNSQISLNARGKKCLLEDKYINVMLNPEISISELSVDNIQEHLIARLIRICNAKLCINKAEEGAEIIIQYGLN
jgi:histidine phosphotransferase ChpT